MQSAPIAALTGFASAEHRLRSHQAGIDVHLVKPAGLQAVLDAFTRPG